MLFFGSADSGGPVAGGKAPFLCSFLEIEISSFRKDVLSFSLSSVEFDFWRKFVSKGNVEFTKPPLLLDLAVTVNIPSSEKYCSVKLIGTRSYEYFEVFSYIQKNGPQDFAEF